VNRNPGGAGEAFRLCTHPGPALPVAEGDGLVKLCTGELLSDCSWRLW
jgi:hypothetical protein